jgi:hypothetical protein
VGRLEVDVLARAETIALRGHGFQSGTMELADKLAAELGRSCRWPQPQAARLPGADRPAPGAYLPAVPRTTGCGLLARGEVIGYAGRIDNHLGRCP